MGYPTRYFEPGHVWHITHRCHDRAFLLEHGCYRDLWIKWLREGRERFFVSVLNFTVTSNHIHLLLVGPEDKEAIPRLMQLVASRVGAIYNKRRNRKGAFWEKRYHATGVETDEYLARCSLYIDLNMNRAGVVEHPGKWKHCGYHEIVRPKKRSRLIDNAELARLMGMPGDFDFSRHYSGWIENSIRKGNLSRDNIWTTELAVGSKSYVEQLRLKMGYTSKVTPGHPAVHDEQSPYGGRRESNALEWEIFDPKEFAS
jgi:putative transposase